MTDDRQKALDAFELWLSCDAGHVLMQHTETIRSALSPHPVDVGAFTEEFWQYFVSEGAPFRDDQAAMVKEIAWACFDYANERNLLQGQPQIDGARETGLNALSDKTNPLMDKEQSARAKAQGQQAECFHVAFDDEMVCLKCSADISSLGTPPLTCKHPRIDHIRGVPKMVDVGALPKVPVHLAAWNSLLGGELELAEMPMETIEYITNLLQGQQAEWQPIETPNNETAVFGRDVLLLYPNGDVVRAYSDGRFWKKHRTTKIVEQGYTHWQPINPPSTGGAEMPNNSDNKGSK